MSLSVLLRTPQNTKRTKSTSTLHKVLQKRTIFLKKSLSKQNSIKKRHKRQVKRNLCSWQICLTRLEHHLMESLGLQSFLKIPVLKRSSKSLLRSLKNLPRIFLRLSTTSLTSLKLRVTNLRSKISHLTLLKSLKVLLKCMLYVLVKNTSTLDVSSIQSLKNRSKGIQPKSKRLSSTFLVMQLSLQALLGQSMSISANSSLLRKGLRVFDLRFKIVVLGLRVSKKQESLKRSPKQILPLHVSMVVQGLGLLSPLVSLNLWVDSLIFTLSQVKGQHSSSLSILKRLKVSMNRPKVLSLASMHLY